MSKKQTSVITELRKKTGANTYINYPIGANLRNIFAMRGSSNNNFEEQIAFGTDKITKSWYDNQGNVYRQTIEYRNQNTADNFYYVEVFRYRMEDSGVTGINYNNSALNFTTTGIDEPPQTDSNVYVIGEDIYFESELFMVGNSLQQDENSTSIHYDSTRNGLFIAPLVILERDELYFKDANGDTLISTKEIQEYYDEDNHLVVSEIITKV